MGYWGWRQMFSFCVSVLVVGCSTTHDAASTIAPTLLPPVTLIARARITPTPPVQLLLPEASPESSSTPMVYTIQRGDTLLGIAAQFGTSLDALKAANDNLNPLTLPIGATLIIPNPSFNSDGQPVLPTSTPVSLVLSTPNCYPTTTGAILCMGLVTNTSSDSVGRVNVGVRLYRPDSSLLQTGMTGVEQNVIPAGAAAPYSLVFRADWAGYGGVAAFLGSADYSSVKNSRSVELSVHDQQHIIQDGVYTVFAVVENPHSATAYIKRGVLILWDANGNLIGYRVQMMNLQVDANTQVPIQVSAVPRVAGAVHHTLYIESEYWP
ncbi:MAG: LysM peptidoglycan-binding domain-containing protein [Anaerolineae bacterium]